jgi:hypothetical protein
MGTSIGELDQLQLDSKRDDVDRKTLGEGVACRDRLSSFFFEIFTYYTTKEGAGVGVCPR